jgi:hypothetical protein
MPVIIGELHANVEIERPVAAGTPPAAATDVRDEEKLRATKISAERFERERRIDQRDPERLGAR